MAVHTISTPSLNANAPRQKTGKSGAKTNSPFGGGANRGSPKAASPTITTEVVSATTVKPTTQTVGSTVNTKA